MNKQPKIKFVGLHAHSVAGSIFDAIGFPQDHMDFAYENGCEALALTDHGNMNGLAYQVLHAKKMQAAGKNFKPIFGCEAYFTPSISEWHDAYNQAMADKKRAKAIKKEKYNEGIIASSACLGGVYAGNYWENREDGDEAVLDAMRESTARMVDIFGDRWYAEIQWNNIKEQHELNQYVIQVAQRVWRWTGHDSRQPLPQP